LKYSISYQESIDIINNINISDIQTQKVFISDALNQTLAQEIVANENSPAYPTSSMDGYAIKIKDQDNPIQIQNQDNPAGKDISETVENGTCIKTFTGSLVPNGAQAIIPIENVTVKDNTIIVNEKVKDGFAIRKVGENYKENEVLIQKNSNISFAQIGVMASLNIPIVKVYKKPTVSVLSTGSEILDIGQIQTNKAQIRSSNHLVIEAICKQQNANVLQLGVEKDDKENLTKIIVNALENSDIVVTTGGVSVGDYDFVKDIIKDAIGANVLFQKVSIKPGQHIIVAQKNNKFIVGLPGFAYSSTVTALLYVVPLIHKLQNSNKTLEIVEATIQEDFGKNMNKTAFFACNLINKDGNFYVNFDGKKSGTSAILTNMLDNSALLILESDCNGYKKGDKVKVVRV
jgi:molybdopterin molybdotransferase